MPRKQDTQTTSCLVCSGTDETLLYKKDSFRIVKCERCGLVFVNPRLSAKALEAMYNANEISPEEYYEANIPQDLTNFKKRLGIISRYKKKPGTLLDIGCNIGTMVKVAKDAGWKAKGVEFNRGAVRFGRKRLGVDIEMRDFMKTRYKAQSFDVVTMMDVIEHVTEPIKTLQEVHRILKPGGLLFMSTPNIDTFMAKISKTKWLHLKPNEHLSYFSPRTIKLLLARTSFRLEKVQSIGRIRNLETILQKSKTYSPIPYTLSMIVPRIIKENINLHIDPGDEMAVIAFRK